MAETKILTNSQTKNEKAFWFWDICKAETDFTGRTNIDNGFFQKIYRRCQPRYNMPMLKRSAAEIYDKKKRTRKFQTSWMKDRPWLFHDKEKDREIELLR
jgi:hypothetical protein